MTTHCTRVFVAWLRPNILSDSSVEQLGHKKSMKKVDDEGRIQGLDVEQVRI